MSTAELKLVFVTMVILLALANGASAYANIKAGRFRRAMLSMFACGWCSAFALATVMMT